MSTRIENGSRSARLSHARRAVAATVVVALTATGISLAAAPGAGAATPPLAQSVGRFLDGALGTTPIQQLAQVQDARAFAPGSQTTQNPLDATLLNSLELPLTHALQLPQLLGITLGAANQVAVAHNDGFSYGGSGAVNNSGGVSVGGDNSAFPADATINLSPTGIAGNTALPIPGGGTADALGGVLVTVGAVSALASTPSGVDAGSSTHYNIADLKLQLGSPLIGGLLTNVSGVLGGLITSLGAGASALGLALPATCPLTGGTLPNLSLEGGAITINSSTGALTIDLEALLTQLGLGNLASGLAPNTDVIDLLLNYLTSPSGLAAGLTGVINGLVGGLESSFSSCLPPLLAGLLAPLIAGGSTLQTAITGIVTQLGAAAGSNPLAPLGTVLKKLVDIGINVQPNGPAGTFHSALNGSPDQATPAVAGQTVVRAIEVNVLGTAATLALANAAAGPSAAAPVSPTSSSASVAPTSTAIPTGVPAGFDKQAGGPALPLVVLLVGLLMAGGGALAWRLRAPHAR